MRDLGSALARRQSDTANVVEYFRAHVGEWVDTDTLERLGGRRAWRTRVADARRRFCKELGWPYPITDGPDPILNRQRRTVRTEPDGRKRVVGPIISEYRYWPHESLGRDATVPSEPRSDGLLFDLHPRS